ncbi:hypothetical protein ABK040_009719 [Willaertia magna]
MKKIKSTKKNSSTTLIVFSKIHYITRSNQYNNDNHDNNNKEDNNDNTGNNKEELFNNNEIVNLLFKRLNESGKEEFIKLRKFEKKLNFNFDISLKFENKNRYSNILANEETRVKIEMDKNFYINANYIQISKNVKAIATQGPLQNTIYDFYKMIIVKNVPCIVMLANVMENGREKCAKYWPDLNQKIIVNDNTLQQNQIIVTNISEKKLNQNLFERELQLKFLENSKNITKNIKFLQYVGWPDFGVPENLQEFQDLLFRLISLNNLQNNLQENLQENYTTFNITLQNDPNLQHTLQNHLQQNNSTLNTTLHHKNHHVMLNENQQNDKIHYVVHCSAGVGRTGTFCLIDSILRDLLINKIELNNELNIFYKRTKLLKSQRFGMIQTVDQYLFTYQVIINILQNNLLSF